MNIPALREAYLEDLYDDRKKLRVELPAEGFELYASISFATIYGGIGEQRVKLTLSSEAVAQAYATKPTVREMMDAIEVASAKGESPPSWKRCTSQEQAKGFLLNSLSKWISANFGKESRETAGEAAKNALELATDAVDPDCDHPRTKMQMALIVAEPAFRWFPTFYDLLKKEVARALGTQESA